MTRYLRQRLAELRCDARAVVLDEGRNSITVLVAPFDPEDWPDRWTPMYVMELSDDAARSTRPAKH